MYTQEDLQIAEQTVRRRAWGLFLPTALLLACYIAFIMLRLRWAMLITLLLLFVYAVIYADVFLLPEVRYKQFLKQMTVNLRRKAEGTITALDADEQIQDGARVRTLHVELANGAGEHIFWVNASKTAFVPPIGTAVQIISSGRHVIELRSVTA